MTQPTVIPKMQGDPMPSQHSSSQLLMELANLHEKQSETNSKIAFLLE